MILHTLGAERLVERTGDLGNSVADEGPDAFKRSPTTRFRACCVTHVELGFLVTPRMCTRREPTSIAKSA